MFPDVVVQPEPLHVESRYTCKNIEMYLISEAWGYLIVSIYTRAAQQLLPDLWRLWQCIEVPFLQSAQKLHDASCPTKAASGPDCMCVGIPCAALTMPAEIQAAGQPDTQTERSKE